MWGKNLSQNRRRRTVAEWTFYRDSASRWSHPVRIFKGLTPYQIKSPPFFIPIRQITSYVGTDFSLWSYPAPHSLFDWSLGPPSLFNRSPDLLSPFKLSQHFFVLAHRHRESFIWLIRHTFHPKLIQIRHNSQFCLIRCLITWKILWTARHWLWTKIGLGEPVHWWLDQR